MEKIAPLGNLKQLESGLDRAVYAESHPENKSERWQPEEFTHNHLKEVEIGGCKGTIREVGDGMMLMLKLGVSVYPVFGYGAGQTEAGKYLLKGNNEARMNQY
ncbi:hypothetical protein GBA52_015566 [Prunus armeniaca]|nr:hypothetical protein GBA52_015566 [Prunus armeniaca]